MKNFIKTRDKETADKLKNLGYELIEFSNGFYVFLNCSDIKVNFEELNNVTQTDILNI